MPNDRNSHQQRLDLGGETVSGFQGAKLELARTFKGFTQEQLAREVSTSNALISYYENGKQADPPSDLVEAWGEVLGFEPEFFYHPIRDVFRDEECSFRHRRTTAEQLKRRARAFGTLVGEVVGYLKIHLDFPEYDIPSVTERDAEKAAETCRSRWSLGNDTPIVHMGRVLENAGIPVVKTLASTEKIDAFSRRGPTPVVILNTFKQSPSHWIFDMAHELGHFVCHSEQVTGSLDTEREADEFASAFLLPAQAFAREFRSMPFSWDHVFALKMRWQVSAAAIVYRAWALDLIDATTYRRAYKYLSARGWKKGEPQEPAPQEPELLRESIKALNIELGEHPIEVCKGLHFKPETFGEVTGITVPTPERRREVLEFPNAR